MGLAKEFTLANHFFHAAFGGSMLNHFFLICGCAPVFDNPVEPVRKKFQPKLMTIRDAYGAEPVTREREEDSPQSALDGPPRHKRFGRLTGDLEAIGTLQPGNPISKHDKTEAQERLPPLHLPTIGDRLSEKNVSWAWYAGGARRQGDGFAQRAEPAIVSRAAEIAFCPSGGDGADTATFAPKKRRRWRHVVTSNCFIFCFCRHGGVAQASCPTC